MKQLRTIPLHSELLRELCQRAGLNDKETQLLEQLPKDARKDLEMSAQQALADQRFQNVLSHPEDYAGLGDWIRALREAKNITLNDVGKALGITRERVRQREEKAIIDYSSSLQGAYKWIDRLVEENPLRFDRDGAGQVKPEIVVALKAKAEEESRNFRKGTDDTPKTGGGAEEASPPTFIERVTSGQPHVVDAAEQPSLNEDSPMPTKPWREPGAQR